MGGRCHCDQCRGVWGLCAHCAEKDAHSTDSVSVYGCQSPWMEARKAIATKETDMDESDRYQRARRRVRTIKGFYAHLIVYLIVNAGLLLINVFNQPGNWWFVWPLLGWGIALVAHAVFAFGIGGWLD